MKKKLSLVELSVKSFLTDVNAAQAINGGGKVPTLDGCMTNNTTANPICHTTTVNITLDGCFTNNTTSNNICDQTR